MSEPRTKAGRALLHEIEYDLEEQGGARASIDDAKAGFRDRILAIEAEAARDALADAARRVDALIEVASRARAMAELDSTGDRMLIARRLRALRTALSALDAGGDW